MQDSPMFVEIRQETKEKRPRTIEAFVVEVEPRECSQIVKKLARTFPLSKYFQHLKRVRKPPNPIQNDDGEQTTKKPKLMLQLLIGSEQDTLDGTVSDMGPFHRVAVPGRPPESSEENKEFNALWPTNFFPLKSDEHKEQEMAITDHKELEFIQQTIKEALSTKSVVIVDPNTRTIVSRSKEEAALQKSGVHNNPLATPILFALQGVSRRERHAASNLSGEDFSKGQYLCTGFDLYTYYEPAVFEAMSCVHSRLRRLIFAEVETSSEPQGRVAWTKGCSHHYVHCLPGTNHKFRAFRYDPTMK
jgi:tRNA-specific adenosine deaminase 3